MREVVLPRGPARPPAPGPQGSCQRRPGLFDRVELQCTLDQDGYVLLAETWDPGWTATLDGAPAEILRANFGFRAVAAPAGTHRIEMTYRPLPLVLGLAVSGFGWLAALACVAVRRRTPSLANGGEP